MSTPARTLLVLRHSKSAYPEGVADIDRPLGPRGVRDAVTLGGWLLGQGLLPDLVVCSTAARTRQTWDLVSDQLVWPDEDAMVVRYDPRVYDADPGRPDGHRPRKRLPTWPCWLWWATTRARRSWCSP